MGARVTGGTPGAGWLDELSFGAGPPWHAMGTRALPEDRWLVPDEEHGVDLARKQALLADARDVVSGSCPGAGEAIEEAAQLLARTVGGTLDPHRDPLEAAALLVQEDLCLLRRGGEGWALVAGVVCFPSMWRLPDKLGLHVTAVHGPVPAYEAELAGRVDRLLDRLRPERPAWRRNWLLHDSPELHLPDPPPPRSGVSVPEDLWLRSERQALRRLPATGAILFTIRTQQAPLAVLAGRPDLAAAMAGAIRSWDDELVSYRAAGAWREPVLDWLVEVAGADRQAGARARAWAEQPGPRPGADDMTHRSERGPSSPDRMT